METIYLGIRLMSIARIIPRCPYCGSSDPDRKCLSCGFDGSVPLERHVSSTPRLSICPVCGDFVAFAAEEVCLFCHVKEVHQFSKGMDAKTSRDFSVARKWFLKAAIQGDFRAEFHLAQMNEACLSG